MNKIEISINKFSAYDEELSIQQIHGTPVTVIIDEFDEDKYSESKSLRLRQRAIIDAANIELQQTLKSTEAILNQLLAKTHQAINELHIEERQ